MIEQEHARSLLEDFGLDTAAVLLDAQIERSLKAEDTYIQFLDSLLTTERQERDRKRLERRIKSAKLPYQKQLDEFDFSFQPGIDKRLIDELATTAFAARAENIVFLGPPGVGKTHLSVGLALKALDAGMTVRFTTLSHMIMDLERADIMKRPARIWGFYTNPDLLILDEIGYMQLTRGQAEMVFRVVSDRYERGSIIMTSNKHFSDWGELLSDNVIATALLDRLLHHAHVINIRGDSYRLKNRIRAGGAISAPRETGVK